MDGKAVVLDIMDTAGQDEYCQMQDAWMREGNGFLLVYSIIDRPTFDEVQVASRIVLLLLVLLLQFCFVSMSVSVE